MEYSETESANFYMENQNPIPPIYPGFQDNQMLRYTTHPTPHIPVPTTPPVAVPVPAPVSSFVPVPSPAPVSSFVPVPSPAPVSSFVPVPSPAPVSSFVPVHSPAPVSSFEPAVADVPAPVAIPAPVATPASAPWKFPSDKYIIPSYRKKACCYAGCFGTILTVLLVVIAVSVGLRYGPSVWSQLIKEKEPEVCPITTVRCDGKKDCSQGSDESDCVRFGTANELQVKTKTGDFLPVCAQGWSQSIANQTCKQLGFKYGFENSVLQSNSSSFQSVNNGQFSSNIQGSVQASSSCPDNKIVSLRCVDCGKPINIKIIGGAEAVAGQWPWQASLHFKRSHKCGATLIAPNFILTAAQCFSNEPSGTLLLSNWQVFIGMVSLLDLPNPYFLRQIIIHEHYSPTTKENDIALLKLETSVNNIQPACLPVSGQIFPSDKQCWTSGFGFTQESNSSSTSLMEVDVNLINLTTCNSAGVYNGAITNKMQCAGHLDGGKDSCQGDRGGPLLCKEDGRWILTGVANWGYGCGRKNRPGVYANVERFLPWIHSKMQQSNNLV